MDVEDCLDKCGGGVGGVDDVDCPDLCGGGVDDVDGPDLCGGGVGGVDDRWSLVGHEA